MTDVNREREEEVDVEKPVVTDKRRIDPETGKVRQPDAAAGTTAEPGAAAAASAAGPGTAGGPATESGPDPLEAARAESLDLADQLARRNADIYNLQQEYNAYVRRSKAEVANHKQAGVHDVVEALLGVLDELELARQHGDLTGPFAAIAEKLEGTLRQRFDVERYGQVGEEFDPEVHEALMHQADPAATATTVSQVLQPGYRAGEKVLRAARVGVTGPQ
ncbi:nucleotide exchange factor GrpE [Georgenia yuyongxinii]|uniref:Protein GrpE n=2 Tax=Georgenia yuyongxinii TaxID=2589797 RepID=A0A5B8C9D7_9MICO|nr:nucleotide exchange factor GrpE [Georgenia yuyongxinii]QDC26151.1 nucleotide exchange factor GrpE [Georgenia yuyongxinii]